VQSLSAIIIPAPGQAPLSLAELAERPGLAATVVVKAGDGARLHQRGQLAEALWLRSAVLLLFEDPAEAATFERAVTTAREAAERAKGRLMGAAWRCRHRAV
jgi:hypothetical protein